MVAARSETRVEFKKVISLGPSCEAAWQIRQVVDQPEAYVFDWIIASPASVAEAIRSDYAGIVEPDRLEYRNEAGLDHPFILDRATGIEYHHDFRNDASFMESYEDVRSKYEFLKDRMRSTLEDGPILFVHIADDPAEADLLAAAVEAQYPSLPYRLLSVRINGAGPELVDRGGILHAQIPGQGTTWQDREAEWAEILAAAMNGRAILPSAAEQSTPA